MDAGPAVERVDFETGIFGQGGQLRGVGVGAGLAGRVVLVGLAVLHDVQLSNAGLGGGHQFPALLAKQGLELTQLAGVAGREEELVFH